MTKPNFSNPLQDILFSDFVHSVGAEPYGDPEGDLTSACLEVQKLYPETDNRSNCESYHSKTFTRTRKSGVEVLDNLMEVCFDYAGILLQEQFDDEGLEKIEWWVNIGGKNAHHNPHNHGRSKLIGILFVACPEGSGDLVLSRNDGSCYTSTYKNHKWGKCFYITPEKNRFYILPGHLWHWVTYHEGSENRISISINYD